ncbi:YjcZ family sporulation protein [Halalkalibacter nanhaiisediminis]|uniref:Uncharacterized protein (TIGR01732 family) n=1 Tax=Halalkalibacter nanhaiisediminis TaxID=688079 RepID=A0A562QTA8_9BACI|nr:YjcZ family sporulation protein [Halalkalibacter nanhaiisediminis]TWI59992.1 uncharacterized protein (TIGR01732 family) [Halalkalibacter nanhaiisediminis]
MGYYCGRDYGYGAPVAGYQYAPVAGAGYDRKCSNFALIVVLFILLIIVGAAMMGDKC